VLVAHQGNARGGAAVLISKAKGKVRMRINDELWGDYREWESTLQTIEPSDEQVEELRARFTEEERSRLWELLKQRRW
jgi:hypothetical protein